MTEMTGDVRFDGRAIVVTGAGRGLGRALALLLGARGANVVVADNGSAKDGGANQGGLADAVAAEIAAAGGQAVPCAADLATEEGAEQAVATSVESFGRIDGIAHFASPCPDLKPPIDLNLRDLDLVLRVNVHAGAWLARTAWPHMAGAGYGRIVLATSAGAYGAPNNADYSSAKAANIGLTRCLAVDGAAHGILVNAIAPSAMTRMTEGFHPGAFAEWFAETMLPERVAPGAAFLLSEECAITGEVFAMGGGRIARMTLAEAEGVLGCGDSIEAVRRAMPQVMRDESYGFPANLAERSAMVARLFGFGGN